MSNSVVFPDQRLERLTDLMFGTRSTLLSTYELSKEVATLDGDLVECGIAAGCQIGAMKLACPDKTVWGFDSFEGIQLAGPKDTEQPGIGPITHNVNVRPDELLKSSGITACSYDWVTKEALPHMGLNADDFILVKGWVQHTLLGDIPQKIALLRLDMDIYDPTLFALQILWPRLVPGGVLIIDDWNLAGVRAACSEYFEGIGFSPEWIPGDSNPVYCYKKL